MCYVAKVILLRIQILFQITFVVIIIMYSLVCRIMHIQISHKKLVELLIFFFKQTIGIKTKYLIFSIPNYVLNLCDNIYQNISMIIKLVNIIDYNLVIKNPTTYFYLKICCSVTTSINSFVSAILLMISSLNFLLHLFTLLQPTRINKKIFWQVVYYTSYIQKQGKSFLTLFLCVLRLPTQSYYIPRNICMFDKKDSLHFCKLYQFNSRILDFVFLIFYIVSQQLRSNQLVVISSSISTLLCSFT